MTLFKIELLLTVRVRFWTQCEWSKSVVGSGLMKPSVGLAGDPGTWQNSAETEIKKYSLIISIWKNAPVL